MGPMRAASRFAAALIERGLRARVARVRVELYGSLAATGRGHQTDSAVIAGLEGALPDTIEPETLSVALQTVRGSGRLALPGAAAIVFDETRDLVFNFRESLPEHPNAVTFAAFDGDGSALARETFFSVGGGRVCSGLELALREPSTQVPHPYRSGAELLERCREAGLSIPRLAFANECAAAGAEAVRGRLLALWAAMSACIDRGLAAEGALPGSLGTPRRARGMVALLQRDAVPRRTMSEMRWVSAWACAVSEENAAGGRMVTAPTNGAAGVLPAVLKFYERFCDGADDNGIVDFLLAAGAIGGLYIDNASISGAEVGCQGEVGVACSMAAAGLTAALGGSDAQIENAAEIGMEHNLGLTCDPVGGLVQVPCIERNAVAAVKAISASQLALAGDGSHLVSLDRVIEVMRQTGADMHRKYKETSEGGLAVSPVRLIASKGLSRI
jgi:L-serine dehydratase